MEHHFDVDIAKEYGVNAAIILYNINYWIIKNEANGVHNHDGNTWTYNSVRAFAELLPYLSEKQIRSAIKVLIDKSVIVEGNYNTSPYDHTTWYAITEKGKSILQKGQIKVPKMSNQSTENVKSTIQIINTDNKPDSKRSSARTKFQPPTIDEVKAYCAERHNSVNAERFIDYYTSNGWKVGKNPMKDWKAAVRTWERNGYDSGGHTQDPYQLNEDESPIFGGTYL